MIRFYTNYQFVLVLLFAGIVFHGNAQHKDDFNIREMVQPVPLNSKFSEPGYYVWCGSMAKGKDGRFHLFYSRWPKKLGFSAWVTDSEIAHAVADHADGPYRFVNVVLPRRDRKYWDGRVTHNPAVVYHKGKYYLYYMGTTGKKDVTYPASTKEPAWWDYRNHQRIGLAVAENPEGKWTRLDKPILDAGGKADYDGLMVSNPAATIGKNGKVALVYKQVEQNGTQGGGKVRFGVAFANSVNGPYIKEKKAIFEANNADKEWMVAEDPFIWYQHKQYYAIIRDVVGKFTGQEGALALLKSKDARQWVAADHPLVLDKTFTWANGADSKTKLERPSLYIENGVPKYLFGAMDENGEGYRSGSSNIHIPLIKSK